MSLAKPVPLGVELLASIRLSLKTLRKLMANDDPKFALKAASELTKLVAVCHRIGISLAEPTPVDVPEPQPTPPVTPKPLLSSPPIVHSEPLLHESNPPARGKPGGQALTAVLGPIAPPRTTSARAGPTCSVIR